ncbi:MAG TPA: sugar porter family MFS transporter [Rhodopila sp.]|jgi:sugar porter (SP) family MFS transporter|nr:sugar porter family MFS transporter [Rhodopila sp.]
METVTELPAGSPGAGAAARQGAALAYGFGALGGLLFGYDIGVIGGALLFIRKAMALTPLMQGVVVSSILVGALIGAGVSGQVVDRFGPRRLLMLSGALLTLGSGGAALSTGPEMLVAFRVLTGLGVGAASVQVPLYLAELAPTRARGGLTTLNQLMISLGIFVAYLVDYGLAGTGAWRVMIGLAMIPSVLLLVGMWSQPDSPRWLARHGRSAEAHAVLLRTRTATEADAELADMQLAARARRSGLVELLSDPGFRRSLLLACALAVLQQVIGINTIIYYAPTIFSAAGFKSSAAILVAVGLGALTLVTTLVTSQIIDRVGRRPLMLGGALGMALCMTVLGVIFLQGALRGEAMIVLAILCIAAYKVAFSLSWGPIVWVLLPEVLPLNGRGPGMGVAATLNWVANFVVALTFPVMLAVGAGAIFLIFACFAIVAFIVAWRLLHETSGRSLEQIELAGSFTATH